MNVEETAEQKLRRTKVLAICCNTPLLIGPNYPEEMVLPGSLELWCARCKVINYYACIKPELLPAK